MNVHAIYDSLPIEFQAALLVSIHEPESGRFGNEELRHIARHLFFEAPLDPAVVEILNETLDEWMDTQRHLQQRASDALARLNEVDPVDAANGAFPIWFTRPWSQTLLMPWAENLAEAVVDAEAHLSCLT